MPNNTQYQLLPDLSIDEYNALRDDVIARGVMVPVEIDENLNILDGHHRVRICEELGIDYPVITRKGWTEDQKITHVLSLNLNRRHLDKEQRKELEIELRRKGWSYRKIAATVGVSDVTVINDINSIANNLAMPSYIETSDGRQYPSQQRKGEPMPMLFGDDTKGIQIAAQDINRRQKEERKNARNKETPDFPNENYRIFYADPPWFYVQQIEKYGPAERHYQTMTKDELIEMGEKIKEISCDDAVLFMWTTAPKITEALEIIPFWGFRYTGAMFIWDKIKHNYGHYNSVRHELLLICTKGSCLPDTPVLIDSVQSIERTEHSKKPEEFRKIVDTLYKTGKRIELFARQAADGWDVWGNEL